MTDGPMDALWAALEREQRSIAWLARQVDCSANMLYRMHRGDRRPSARLMGKIAAVLRLPVSELFRDEQAA